VPRLLQAAEFSGAILMALLQAASLAWETSADPRKQIYGILYV